ncbi:heat-inducible transcriptional repressor HrcA [Lapidilactobacillus gannanensis]|jgi:heat-inducible transcriptional repressor|uniref:Heat-inducible transcription repressor HrcA n=1 Tax=Lapidilactobacillus gannanensis TaxID=2486002 RepID=A0ABW4BLU4_9LACO|nr:heat-inducible transcriptional repressor HrcA [Lapidilactobacillus gannanensis]MCH4057548.1 heat-inducible transcriptional repressor HrcA [Lactobacillaceae bacterium]
MPTKRQAMILAEIVRIYNETGQPVGSKTLMNQLPIHISSATIRNEMAVLEDDGLITKNHTSSGRVPSTAGYRYYLDNLVQPSAVPRPVFDKIAQNFNHDYREIDDIVKQAATILSSLTNYTAISLGPENAQVTLTGFRVIPLGSDQIIAILATSAGTVESRVYRITGQLDTDDLEKAVRIINDQLVGLPINQVKTKLVTEIPRLLSQYLHSATGFLDLFGDVLKRAAAQHYYIGGRSNLLNFVQPDELDQLKSIYQLLDKESVLPSLLDLDQAATDDEIKQPPMTDHRILGPISVRLGDEFNNSLLSDYGLITAKYHVGQHGDGMIAILGPTSMPYSQLIGLMQLFSDELVKKLFEYYGYFHTDDS